VQFKHRFATSPYRFLIMRRLEYVRTHLVPGATLSALALNAGFADQAHMTRMFKATYGLTPRRYLALQTAVPS
jgi:AraC-like DNA-binding protein